MNVFSELVRAQLEHIDINTEPATIKSRVAYDIATNQAVYSDGTIWKILAPTSGVEILPIGSVLPSMLTEAQFQAELGSTKWVLADGRASTGTDYGTLTALPNIPDLRGLFLRGKNNGRTGTESNPSGDLAIGSFQDDAFQAHNHGGGNHNHAIPNNEYLTPDGVDWSDDEWGGYKGPISENVPTSYSGNIIATEGTNETRPKNITVNYFIKVNR